MGGERRHFGRGLGGEWDRYLLDRFWELLIPDRE